MRFSVDTYLVTNDVASTLGGGRLNAIVACTPHGVKLCRSGTVAPNSYVLPRLHAGKPSVAKARH